MQRAGACLTLRNVADAMGRAWIRQRKLEAKLIDGWQKPKRMRWKTFERLQAGIDECERQKDIALMIVMARMGIT